MYIYYIYIYDKYIWYIYIFIYIYIYNIYIYISMVFTIEGLFEVAIETWPEGELNPRPEFRSDALTD